MWHLELLGSFFGEWKQRFIEVAKRAVFEIKKAASSGRNWPLGQVAASGRKWPQVAASGRKWPLGQVAASGRKWPHVAARGCTWPVALLVGFEISRAASLAAICIICSHLQPLSATRVAASGRKWPQVAAAASGRKWPQVAASGCLDGKYQPEWPYP